LVADASLDVLIFSLTQLLLIALHTVSHFQQDAFGGRYKELRNGRSLAMYLGEMMRHISTLTLL
jgi:hypothetical protein